MGRQSDFVCDPLGDRARLPRAFGVRRVPPVNPPAQRRIKWTEDGATLSRRTMDTRGDSGFTEGQKREGIVAMDSRSGPSLGLGGYCVARIQLDR